MDEEKAGKMERGRERESTSKAIVLLSSLFDLVLTCRDLTRTHTSSMEAYHTGGGPCLFTSFLLPSAIEVLHHMLRLARAHTNLPYTMAMRLGFAYIRIILRLAL